MLSPRAHRDLGGIWEFTASTWGIDQAEQYIRKIWDAMQVVAEDPRRGRTCDEVRPGYSKYVIGSHVHFFRLQGADVVVMRILHGRMDFDRNL